MPENNNIHPVYEKTGGWQLGEPITPIKLDNITNELNFLSEQISDVVNSSSSSNRSPTTTTGHLIHDMIRYYETEADAKDISDYTKLYVCGQMNSDNNTTEIEVPTIDDFNNFKSSFVQLYDENNAIYSAGTYVEKDNIVYKVIQDIDNNWSNEKVTPVKLTQQLFDIIGVYDNQQDIPENSENKILIQRNLDTDENNSFMVPTIKDLANIITEEFNEKTNYHIGDYVLANSVNGICLYRFIEQYEANSGWDLNKVEQINLIQLITTLLSVANE